MTPEDDRLDPSFDDAAPLAEAPAALTPARRIAERAWAFEARMRSLPDDLDVSWQGEFAQRSPALALLPAEDGSRGAALEGVLRRFCGPASPLDRLAADPAQLALQRRPVALRSLCLLALSRRPGVLRCLVDRSQKELLRQALGEALAAVESLAPGGRPVSHEATAWTPLHWSCLGYLDWLGLIGREDTFLRRLVRLLLPRQLLDMPRRVHLARSDLAAAEAVARLGAAGVAWPC